jgi:hypothetical protein
LWDERYHHSTYLKIKKMKNIIFFFAIALVLISSCKQVNCGPGYEVKDCTCYCEPGEKFEARGICKVLEDNEYWGFSSECPCQDTTFFTFSKPFDDPIFGKQVIMTKAFGKQIQFTQDITFNYTQTLNGALLDSPYISSPGCMMSDGAVTQTRFYAEYLPNDTIRYLEVNETMSFFNPRKDTCVWYLHK